MESRGALNSLFHECIRLRAEIPKNRLPSYREVNKFIQEQSVPPQILERAQEYKISSFDDHPNILKYCLAEVDSLTSNYFTKAVIFYQERGFSRFVLNSDFGIGMMLSVHPLRIYESKRAEVEASTTRALLSVPDALSMQLQLQESANLFTQALGEYEKSKEWLTQDPSGFLALDQMEAKINQDLASGKFRGRLIDALVFNGVKLGSSLYKTLYATTR